MTQFSTNDYEMTDVAVVENIVRQTAKAILVDVDGIRHVWIPKSLTIVDDSGVVWVREWFANKNCLGRKFSHRVCVG